jgi:predicted metalloprotease with PDZ domain
MTNPAQHLAEVQINFPVVNGKTLDVQMPIWRTGRYEVLNLGKNIRQFVATNAQGKQLAFTKTDKATWQIKTQAGDTVKVTYEVYANALGERTLHIDDTHAYLDASGVLMYAALFRQQAVQISLETPKTWVSRSGMDKGACEHCFVAKNYDILIDTPIETGEHEFHTFDVDGHTIELAIWGRGNYDGNKMALDLKKVVEGGQKLFGAFPFKRYLFIVHATDGVGGGTEHLNSTVMQKPRWSFAERKGYLSFIRLAAHEFVHTWNVKAYRPKEMVPYEYQRENYSRLLWMAEGNTSYFGELLCLRAGLIKRDEYMENMAKSVLAYQHQPGRFQQSAAESSFDAWIDAHGERGRNASVDIYSKGALLAAAIDIEIRRQTQGKKGFEDVHRYLYQHHTVAQGGYSEADVRTALKFVTGNDWSAWWAQYVDGIAEIPLSDLFKNAGLVFAVESAKDEDQKEEWFTGWSIREGGELAQVSEVERDSPAWNAGVVAGDILIAANGLRLSSKDINERLWLQQQAPIKLALFRRDELREIAITPIRQTKGKAKMKALENASEQQKELNVSWLGVAWPVKKASAAESKPEEAKE